MTRGMLSAVALVAGLLGGVTPAYGLWPNGFAYRRTITVNHSKVAADQSHFPMVIAMTSSDLATRTNGGLLTSNLGYDLIATADAQGLQRLNFERLSWSAQTGSILLIVNAPTLSSSTDTMLYLFYGNASITSDPQNKAGVWDSNYIGVYHLAESAANTTLVDSTSFAHTGASAANTAAKSVTGPIAGGTTGSALSFNGYSDYADLGTSSDWDVTTGDATWEIWLKPSALDTYHQWLARGSYGSDGYYFQWTNQAVVAGGMNFFNGSNGNQLASAANAVAAGAWTHAVFVKSGNIGSWYENGELSSTVAVGNISSSAKHLWLGRPDGNDANANVAMSEFRYSNVARSATWIATGYTNANNPAAFYAVGPAQAAPNSGSSFVIF